MNQLKVLTTNIRFQSTADGENAWTNRKPMFKEIADDFHPDVWGTQEGREPQLRELEAMIKEDYIFVDSHRDWIEERMYPCLFIKKDTFEVIQSGDTWLSETPDIPGSKSFDSAFPRLCTWAKLKHIKSNTEFLICNMHLDHMKTETRQKQIEVFVEQISKIKKDNENLIIMGDFNEGPEGEVRKIIDQSDLKLEDAWLKLTLAEESSYHKFKGTYPLEEGGRRIDWILNTSFVKELSISYDKLNQNGIYASDHFPVKAVFTL